VGGYIARQVRGHNVIAVDALEFMRLVHNSTGPKAGWMTALHERREGNKLVSFFFSWITSQQLSRIRGTPGALTLVGRDYTHSLLRSGALFGADTAIAPNLGGASFMAAQHIALTCGEPGEHTQHMRWHSEFLYTYCGVLPPEVSMLDKDTGAIEGWLLSEQARLDSDAFKRGLASVKADLLLCAESATEQEKKAALKLLESLPSYFPVNQPPPDTSVCEPGVPMRCGIPLLSADLDAWLAACCGAAGAPSLRAPSDAAAHGRVAALFKPAVAKEFYRYLPAIAAIMLETLTLVVELLRTARHAGAWNQAAASALWLLDFCAVESSIPAWLREFILHFTILCYFHVLQALDRAAKEAKHVPNAALGRQLVWRFRNVIEGTQSYAEYKGQASEMLCDAGAVASQDGSFSWLKYLEVNWLSPRYWSLVAFPFRFHLSRFMKMVNNDTETGWNTFKKENAPRAASGHVRELVSLISGSPGSLAEFTHSYVGKQDMHLNQASQATHC